MSITHLTTNEAPRKLLQAFLIVLHFMLYLWLLTKLPGLELAIIFTIVHQGTFGIYNSAVFASNHKGMLLMDDGNRNLGFLREQVLTTRNVTGNRLVDFLYGGLNYQIEHHLFPTMPRNNFRRATAIVTKFCANQGIAYHSTSLPQAYREGFLHLHRAGSSLRTPSEAIA